MPYRQANYFMAFVLVVLVTGFWNSYFRPIADVPTAFHVHAFTALSWVVLLMRQNWEGNVRELENTIERAIILAEGKKITPEHLAIRIRRTDEIQLRDGAGLKEIGAHAQALPRSAQMNPEARAHVIKHHDSAAAVAVGPDSVGKLFGWQFLRDGEVMAEG